MLFSLFERFIELPTPNRMEKEKYIRDGGKRKSQGTREGERERARERERERERHTHTHTETDRHTDRQPLSMH